MRMLCMICCAVLLLVCLPARAEVSARRLSDFTPPLRELAAQYGFKIGICLSPNQLKDAGYLKILSSQFNTTTCTNETKAYSLLDQRASQNSGDGMPRMNYAVADRMIGWAQENGIGVRGHVLTWDAYMTEWFFHEDYSNNKPYPHHAQRSAESLLQLYRRRLCGILLPLCPQRSGSPWR